MRLAVQFLSARRKSRYPTEPGAAAGMSGEGAMRGMSGVTAWVLAAKTTASNCRCRSAEM